MGEHAAERNLREEILRAWRRQSGASTPQTLQSMLDLGRCLWDLQDFEGAKKLQAKVYRERKITLGELDKDTLCALEDFAYSVSRLSNKWATSRLVKDIVQLAERTLQHYDPAEFRAVQKLAGTLSTLDALGDERDLREKIFEAMRITLGESDPNTANALADYALSLCLFADQDEDTDLRQLGLHGHIRNVWSFLKRGGSDELELARTLADAMKYNKDTGADECEVREKILAGLTRELGENHPATRRAREELADAVTRKEDPEAARKMHDSVLQARSILKQRGRIPSRRNVLRIAGILGRQGGRKDESELTGAGLGPRRY
jgi:hypothetical protein